MPANLGLYIGIGVAVVILLIIVITVIYMRSSPTVSEPPLPLPPPPTSVPDSSSAPIVETPPPAPPLNGSSVVETPGPTVYIPPPLAPIPTTPTRVLTNVLDPAGQAGLPDIQQGERLYSNNKQYYLTMQGDGKLVGYNVNSGSSFWSSGSSLKGGPFTAQIQPDGQLVIKNGSGNIVWINKKPGGPNPIITLQDDRNIVGYAGLTPATRTSVFWSTRTNA